MSSRLGLFFPVPGDLETPCDVSQVADSILPSVCLLVALGGTSRHVALILVPMLPLLSAGRVSREIFTLAARQLPPTGPFPVLPLVLRILPTLSSPSVLPPVTPLPPPQPPPAQSFPPFSPISLPPQASPRPPPSAARHGRLRSPVGLRAGRRAAPVQHPTRARRWYAVDGGRAPSPRLAPRPAPGPLPDRPVPRV